MYWLDTLLCTTHISSVKICIQIVTKMVCTSCPLPAPLGKLSHDVLLEKKKTYFIPISQVGTIVKKQSGSASKVNMFIPPHWLVSLHYPMYGARHGPFRWSILTHTSIHSKCGGILIGDWHWTLMEWGSKDHSTSGRNSAAFIKTYCVLTYHPNRQKLTGNGIFFIALWISSFTALSHWGFCAS